MTTPHPPKERAMTEGRKLSYFWVVGIIATISFILAMVFPAMGWTFGWFGCVIAELFERGEA